MKCGGGGGGGGGWETTDRSPFDSWEINDFVTYCGGADAEGDAEEEETEEEPETSPL